MSSVIHVACATDDAFAAHCGTMLRSLLAQHPGSAVQIYVLHDPALSQASRERLQGVAGDTPIRWLPVSAGQLTGFPAERFHISCWYRTLLPQLLPDLARALYIDADVLVLCDLTELWDTDLQGRLFGAVINPLYPFMPDRPRALGLASRAEYLNSGVLLMDLDRMRAAGLVELLRDYASRHPENPWPEQDALSAVCQGQWLKLPPRWNAQTTLFDLPDRQLPFVPEEVAAARASPAIVHFIGPLKPWNFLSRHPLRHLYAQYRRQTPWPEFELEGRTLTNRLLRPFSLGAQLRMRRWLRRLKAHAPELPKRIYRSVRQRLRRAQLRGPRAMAAFARLFPEARFVQIGSNDGSKHDPLRAAFLRSRWSGVLIEPVPYVFERLRRNYGHFPRVQLENVAIAERGGSLPFYHLAKARDGENLPSWYDELGSFHRDVVLKHADRIPDIERRLVTTEVPCVTFDEVCRRNGLEQVDLLHIDAEGYDDVILQSIAFDRPRPVVLIYEHKHLDPVRRQGCRDRLAGLGYEDFSEGADTWCIDGRPRGEPHARLLEVWRRIAGRNRP